MSGGFRKRGDEEKVLAVLIDVAESERRKLDLKGVFVKAVPKKLCSMLPTHLTELNISDNQVRT